MMTSSHGNMFRVTGLLCGEFTGHRLKKTHKGQWWRHCNVVIHSCDFCLVVGSIQNPGVRLLQNGGNDDRRTGLWRHVPFWWSGWGGCVREYVLSYLHHVPLYGHHGDHEPPGKHHQIARFMGPTWGPSGADRTQVGSMLTPWTMLSGSLYMIMAVFSYSGA